jgi:voltage-gated potassium channel
MWVAIIVQFLVEDRIRVILGRRKLDKQIAKLEKSLYHLRVWPNRPGAGTLSHRKIPECGNVIEKNESRQAAMDEDGVLYLVGEATDESLLLRAGIKQAKGLITAWAPMRTTYF